MVTDIPTARSSVAQWGAAASAIFAAIGFLWGIISYVQMIASTVSVMQAEIVKLTNTDTMMQERISRDHDILIRLETELTERIKREKGQ